MKKYYFIAPLIILTLVLSGCGKQSDTLSNDDIDTAATSDQTSSDSDLSVSDSANSSSVSGNQASQSADSNSINKASNMPEMIIDQNKAYTAVMHTTAGDITLSLNAKTTPITVNNFVWLAKKDFYNGVIFHRVIKDFMIQGGDPTGTGSGGPGYQFNDEPFTGEYTRGTLAMANAGPNTNGSQFFIMHADVPLQKDYVIFGNVTKGLETVDKIATAETTRGADGAMSKPVNPVKITSIEVIEK